MTMNFQTVKNLSEIAIEGVSITWTKEDSGIREMRIRDASGNMLAVRSGDYGNCLKIMKPAVEEAWFVEGKFLGVAAVAERFETERQANDRLEEYRTKSESSDDIGLKVVRREVLSSSPATRAADDGIPF
jgi:hypothetical protein